MFYVCEALLLGEGLSFSKHSAVISAFGQVFAKTGRLPEEFHRYLLDARDLRNAGDYDIRALISKEDSVTQIERTESFLKLAENITGELRR